jgi:hypothetical protein
VSIKKNKNASEVAWTRQSTLFARILLNYNPNPRFDVIFCYAVPFVPNQNQSSLILSACLDSISQIQYTSEVDLAMQKDYFGGACNRMSLFLRERFFIVDNLLIQAAGSAKLGALEDSSVFTLNRIDLILLQDHCVLPGPLWLTYVTSCRLVVTGSVCRSDKISLSSY